MPALLRPLVEVGLEGLCLRVGECAHDRDRIAVTSAAFIATATAAGAAGECDADDAECDDRRQDTSVL